METGERERERERERDALEGKPSSLRIAANVHPAHLLSRLSASPWENARDFEISECPSASASDGIRDWARPFLTDDALKLGR